MSTLAAIPLQRNLFPASEMDQYRPAPKPKRPTFWNLLHYIRGLAKGPKGCFCSVEYFAGRFSVGRSTIRRWVSKLKLLGMLQVILRGPRSAIYKVSALFERSSPAGLYISPTDVSRKAEAPLKPAQATRRKTILEERYDDMVAKGEISEATRSEYLRLDALERAERERVA